MSWKQQQRKTKIKNVKGRMRRMKKGLEDGWKNEDDEENEIKM